MQSEQELVAAAQQGDGNAFGELYERYVDKIFRYFMLRLGHREEAEDLAEEVFLKALQSLASFQWRGAPFSSWLFRIAHNLIVDRHRKSSKMETLPIEDSPNIGGNQNVEELVELKSALEETYATMRLLTPAQQQVLALRFAGELSVAEVAKIMGKKEGAIKALQHSAVASLRRNLSRNPANSRESRQEAPFGRRKQIAPGPD